MSTVVTYFSASGVTRNKAQQLAKVAKADLYEIKPAVAYTSADLNWMDKRAEAPWNPGPQLPSCTGRQETQPGQIRYCLYRLPHLVVHRPKIINTFIGQPT